jgi:hypothetical protein
VVDLSRLVVEVGLQGDEVAAAADEATRFEVHGPHGTRQAVLDHVAHAADPRTLDWPARLVVSEGELLAGVPVEVTLRMPLRGATGVVPHAAMADDEGTRVWLVTGADERVASARSVRVLGEVPGGVALSGVDVGDRVVVFGHEVLSEGTRVVELEAAP